MTPISICIVILFFPIFLLHILKQMKKKMGGANLPPSPLKLPIIGNIYQIGKLPHQCLWQLSQKYGPLMLLHLGNTPTLVVSSAQMAQQVLQAHDLDFCSRPGSPGPKKLSYGFSDMAFSQFDDQYREKRKIFNSGLFNSRRGRSFQYAREVEVDRLVNSLSSFPVPVNLDEMMCGLVGGIVCGVAFGKSYREGSFKNKELKGFLEEAMDALESFSAEDFFPSIGWVVDLVTGHRSRLEKCFRNLDGYFQKVIDEHLDHQNLKPDHEDLVDALLGLSKDETGSFRLTKDHIKAFLLNIFLGGTDSSVVTIVYAMAELVKNPAVMQKLQTLIRQSVGRKPKVFTEDLPNLTYLKMVVKETLRLHPPAPLLIPHQSIRHCKINDYDVFPGTRVLVNVWGIARDPISWENPNEFIPERFENGEIDFRGRNFEFLPFGAGRRFCPGVNMAISTIEYTLANLLYSFDWELPDGVGREDISLEEERGLVIHKKTPLFLIPIKYN